MKIERETFLAFAETLTYAVIVLGAVTACLIVIYAMRRRERKEEKLTEEGKAKMELKGLPFKIVKSVSPNEMTHAKGELRILDLEREILSDAIRRLYEAHADGKITEEERERLARTYKSRMMVVKDAISKDESLVALHELEAMQEDLIKLFSERFSDVSAKVESLRSKLEVEPIKEIAVPTAEAPATAEKPAAKGKAKKKRKRTRAKPSPKTLAEKRIEKIRAEVEKVLDKLGQMEVES
jgi:hypothetical protein